MAKQHNVFHPSALALATCLSLAPALIGLSLAHAAPPAKKATAQQQPITLNFVNAEIESVARTLATLSNRNLVVDPRVKGTINLTTELPVSPNEAWSQFLAALRLQGFAMVETKGLYKIVPEADAKLQGGNVQEIYKGNGGSGSGQIVTHIFKLNFEQANNLVPVLRPLISPNNTINVNPGNNSIIITDYADNLQRMARIIATLDVSNASDVEVIQLKHAIAVDLAPLVLRLVESGSNTPQAAATPGQTGAEYKTTLLAEPRSNALILRAANPARVALVKSLVAKLDQPNGTNANGNIHVVYLKNADATKLATTLRAAVSGQVTGNAGTSASPSLANTATNPVPPTSTPATSGSTLGSNTTSSGSATGGQIQADTATNSLIITAPEPQYRQLRAVIDMLDQRRAQVMVESLIAEVNADKAAQMGIQWQTARGESGGTVGIIGTNFNNPLNSGISSATGGGNIIGASGGATALGALGNGLNIASAKQINGTYTLGALATFLQTNADSNILSTPTLMTIDNEEARIVVGQNVPFITGSYSTPTTAGANPFQTIERKDVGITLKVKPQISESGTVKLNIYQEVSSVTKTDPQSGPTTNKRSIESNVLVEDGSIIVLGGLLSEDYVGANSQVPGFGDIPVIGWLFKSESRSRTKKNLMVFLRPVVMRDAAATEALSNNRYQQMMGLQQNAQPGFNPILGSGNSPVLPPAPAPKPKTEAKPGSDIPLDTPASSVPAATPAR
jgi:general secretion pathway protein D